MVDQELLTLTFSAVREAAKCVEAAEEEQAAISLCSDAGLRERALLAARAHSSLASYHLHVAKLLLCPRLEGGVARLDTEKIFAAGG